MEISFELTPEDYRQAAIVWRNMRWWRRLAFPFMTLFAAFAALMTCIQAYLYPSAANCGIAAAIIGAFVIWLVMLRIGPGISARRQFRAMPAAQGLSRVEISDSGLHSQSPTHDSQISWSTYIGWAEGKSVFILLPQPRIFVPIPKRALNEQQISEFRGLLGRNAAKA